MIARQVDLAGGNQKAAMDQIDDAVREVGREVRSIIRRAVLAQLARHIHPRIPLRRQLDVRIGFVVAQQNVVARLLLLDQVVFKRQRLALVAHHDVFNIDGFTQQASGLGVLAGALHKIRAHPRPQVLRLANVDDLAFGVLVEIHARIDRNRFDLLIQIHRLNAFALAGRSWRF